MRKFAAVLVALSSVLMWFITFHPTVLGGAGMQDQDGQAALTATRWVIFVLGTGITAALWKWSNHSAQRKQAKLIADAIAASNNQPKGN